VAEQFPIPSNDTEARELLNRITMTGLHRSKVRRGVAWSMTVLFDGSPIMIASNDGDGGCNLYHPVPFGPRRVWALATEGALAIAAELLTGCQWEAFDSVTAALEAGMTAADAADAYRNFGLSEVG
jgi:hypothetical protein